MTGDQSDDRAPDDGAAPLPAPLERFLGRLAALAPRDWLRALEVLRRAETRGTSLIDAVAAASRAARTAGLSTDVIRAQDAARAVAERVDWDAARPRVDPHDVPALELLAEWGALAVLVRPHAPEPVVRALYAPFAGLIRAEDLGDTP